MTFKDSSLQFQIVDITTLQPDPRHARQNINEDNLKGLVNSIEKVGLIQPVVVRPADAAGNYTVIAGERRRQAALIAGEKTIPVVIRACDPDEMLKVQVFENIGLGVRSALEPRDMANAIQTISEHFGTLEEAAQYFGRAPTWLSQATAAANLSEKVSALLDSGKITSTGTAVQLEKLAKKDEAKAESLIGQIEQLPEGEKVSKKVVDHALSEASGRRKKTEEPLPSSDPVLSAPLETAPAPAAVVSVPPWESEPAAPPVAATTSAARSKVSPGKVKLVAELLGLNEDDEEEILVRLIDEFLAMKNA